MDSLKQKIRTIPDFPKPGILFRDITTLLADPEAFNSVIDLFLEHYHEEQIDLVVGIESRGFIIGAPLALRLGKGFIPVRKAGKLPVPTEYVNKKETYISQIIDEWIPKVSERKLAKYIDVFCEKGYFDINETSIVYFFDVSGRLNYFNKW